MASQKCNQCDEKVSTLLGVTCRCGLCQSHCEEICSDDECECLDDLLAVRLDGEFSSEEEMQKYARNKGKVVLTDHTRPIIDE